ncbi:MAG: hypothetical protein ABSE69_20340 [Roseiarcus sp.]|jgi:hypothetical protein
MSRYILAPPPNDSSRFKESYLYCWAAGLASFLNVTKLGGVSYSDIVGATGAYMNADGSIPETGGTPVDNQGVAIPGAISGGIGAVFSLYNVYSTLINCSTFSYQYVLNILQTKGHMIIMYGVGGGMGHTQVVYGVGVPDDNNISLFDPMTSATDYQNIPITTVSGSGSNMYVAWAAWAGP